MEQNENNHVQRASKKYAKLQLERLEKNPSHPIEYIIANAYAKGWKDKIKYELTIKEATK